jgi:hypothetical protein
LFTHIVDTFPIYTYNPENMLYSSSLFNPHYGGTIFKFQIMIDFLGRLLLFSGPHLGTSYDGHIYLNTFKQLPGAPPPRAVKLPWEWGLGDGHYCACANMLTPFRRPRHGHLPAEEAYFNEILSHYRSRVEHINSYIERHKMFQEVYRGSDSLLASAMTVTLQTTNIKLRRCLRYPAWGPHSHLPD